jgi:RHS repeat-associated protein
MAKKIISCILIVAHILTFAGVRDALAFQAQSASFKLKSGALSEGGKGRVGASLKLSQDVIGEPCIGKSQSASFILNSGYIPTLISNPPQQTQVIPNEIWDQNIPLNNAFDLDSHFMSPDGLLIAYSVTGNQHINVAIDTTTHLVSFSQAYGWSGTEIVRFRALDADGNSVLSNEVTLQVIAVNNPPVLDFIPDISANEGSLVTITPHATDVGGGAITYSFTAPLNAQGQWQTGFSDAGLYTVNVTAKDATNLTATQQVRINVRNVNRPPVLNAISNIAANEGNLVVITPVATDPDGDAVTFYYSSPFDATGKWLTGYSDAGTRNVTVTASDGIDTVNRSVNVTINNVNRKPAMTLTVDQYTANPNTTLAITLVATDPDLNPMTYVIKKDGATIGSGAYASTVTLTTSFSAIGDHTISATVTDNGGLAVSETKGIDIVDPALNQYAINPVMGDFNGDCLMDLGLHNSDTGKWEVAISQAGVFTNAVDWLSGFGVTRDWAPTGGDFNGDGRTDVGIYNSATGEFKPALSNGSGFAAGGAWFTLSGASSSWQIFTGNFNADKFTDLGFYNKDTGEVKAALSTGSGFGVQTTWLNPADTGYSATSGDFNGDGLSDLCLFKKSTGAFKVAFSNSKTFVDGSVWKSGYAVNQDPILSDFNHDGLTDIGYWEKTSGVWHYAISSGNQFSEKGAWLGNYGTIEDESATTGDFNGDGVTDRALFKRSAQGINRWKTQLNTLKPVDLMTEINNGIGGKTRVVYTYASKFENDSLPFPVYVASSISLLDTLPVGQPQETYSQNFSFAGGYYDAAEREFRGFSKIKVTDPITNNYTETYFYQGKAGQDGALKGQIEKMLAFDGNARQISQVVNTYEVKKAGPAENVLGFPSLTQMETKIWEENGSSISTRSHIIYDNIGNPVEALDEGDILKTGDEKTTATVYAPAYGANGFNRPLEVALKDKDLNVVSKKIFQYDPKGNLKKESINIYNPLTIDYRLSTIDYNYDSFGNLISTTDALDHTVTTEYETTYYAYPYRIFNSLEHTISYVYDPKFGVVTSVTDANGKTSGTTHDTFGRVVSARNSNNEVVVTYDYPDFNTKVSTNALGLTKTEYVDGLGRKYKAVSVGEDGANAREVSSEVYFNNRGLVDRESIAHYINEAEDQISYTRTEYDLRGRVKKTVADFPGVSKDAESSVNYISPLYVETTDSKGNVTQIWYDSIGRKLKMNDPDMGIWTYEYDLVGNLKKQTDAKNQILEFNYDALNRLTDKLANGQIIVTYQYDAVAKPNCVGRLSKIVDQSGSTEFFYDNLGRETKSIKTVAGSAYTVERTYDILDRLLTLKYPDGSIANYSYDVHSGLLEKVTGQPATGQPVNQTYVNDITYNAKGQINTIKYGNNTQTTYTYGQDLRLSRILTSTSALTLQDLNYVFDKNGNITTLTDNLRSNIRTYGYDDLDRLTQAQNLPSPQGGTTNFNYQYDSIGNMTYKSDLGVMSYGAGAGPHALTSAGGYSYQYDLNGNMTVGKNKIMSYDIENRLTYAVCGLSTNSYVYDGDGGRVKQVTSHQSQVTSDTTYIGSLFEIEQASGSGQQATAKHIFAGSTKVCDVKSVDGGPATLSYYHSDHLGSSSVITDQSGQQVAHYEYSPYGAITVNELANGQTGQPANYYFTGKELDATGLYFYGARYYDPEIGRFITADTIVQAPYDPQSLNRYAYCRNNPLNYVDPSGHWWFIVAAIISAVKAVAAAAIATAIAHPVLTAIGFAVSMTMGGMNAASAGYSVWQGIGIGFLSAGIGLGVGGVAGGGLWGAVAGSFAAGFVGGALTAGAQGASFGQALAFGFQTGAISAATAVVTYGAAKVIEKTIAAVQNASKARAASVGTKTPVTQQNQNSASSKSQATLKTNYDIEGKPVSYDLIPEDVPRAGAKIYRVYDNRPYGRSWTPIDPRGVDNYAGKSGMYNSGRFLIEGTLKDASGVIFKSADPGPYGNGGLTEWVVPHSEAQVQIDNVYGLNPELGGSGQ